MFFPVGCFFPLGVFLVGCFFPLGALECRLCLPLKLSIFRFQFSITQNCIPQFCVNLPWNLLEFVCNLKKLSTREKFPKILFYSFLHNPTGNSFGNPVDKVSHNILCGNVRIYYTTFPAGFQHNSLLGTSTFPTDFNISTQPNTKTVLLLYIFTYIFIYLKKFFSRNFFPGKEIVL